MLSLGSCAVDERMNKDRVRLAEGYYKLGKYDLSIAKAQMVPKDSKFYTAATYWKDLAYNDDQKARKLGYDNTYVGSADGYSEWKKRATMKQSKNRK